VCFDHVASFVKNADHRVMSAAVKLCVTDCIADRIRLAIPQATEGQRLGAFAGEVCDAERCELAFTGHLVAVDLDGELERHRHRVGNVRAPGERVAVDLAGEFLSAHFGVDLAGEGVAAGGDGYIHGARAYGRVHGDFPVAVRGHSPSQELVSQLRLEAATAQVTFVALPSPERGEDYSGACSASATGDRRAAHQDQIDAAMIFPGADFIKVLSRGHPALDFPHCASSDGYEKITKRR